MISAILFHTEDNTIQGVRIHSFGDEVVEMLENRFGGDYDSVVEFINSGISGGGYLTADDVSTYNSPGVSYGSDSMTELLDNELSIVNAGVDHIYRLEQNGVIREVLPKTTIRFIVKTDKNTTGTRVW